MEEGGRGVSSCSTLLWCLGFCVVLLLVVKQTQGYISIDTCLELQLEVKIQTQLELGDLSPLGGPRYLLRRIARAAAKRIRIAAVSV